MVSRNAGRGAAYTQHLIRTRSRWLPFVVAGVVMGICTRYMYHQQQPAGGQGAHQGSFWGLSGDGDWRDDTCHDSWVLKHINASQQHLVEEKNAAWYDSLPKLLERAYDKNTLTRAGDGGDPIEPTTWDRFDVMMPPMDGACQMEKIGLKDWDGGKLVCGIQDIPDNKERPCVIYSIGSKNQWDFEVDAYKSTTCTIHTFDCTIETGNMPAHIRDRVTFHKICMGSSENDSPGKKFMNLKEIMDMLGHSYVTLLKVGKKGREGGREEEKERKEKGSWTLFLNFTISLIRSLSSHSLVHCLGRAEWAQEVCDVGLVLDHSLHFFPIHFVSPILPPLMTQQADIEGFEYDLFNELLIVDSVELPEQISFELHYKVIDRELSWMPRQKTAGEIALLGTRLYEQGYRVLSREDNV